MYCSKLLWALLGILLHYPAAGMGQVNPPRPRTQKETLRASVAAHHQQLQDAQTYVANYGYPASCTIAGEPVGVLAGLDAQGLPVCMRPFMTPSTPAGGGAPVRAAVTTLWGMEASFVDYLWPGGGQGYSLTGQGVTLGSREVARCTHQEFIETGQSRIVQTPDITDPCGENVPLSTRNHGTHVAGRMVSAGAADQASIGAAYAAHLRPTQTFTQLALAGVMMANSSVTTPGGSDDTAYAAPYFLGVQAAGNACFQNCIGVYGGINQEGGGPVTKNFLTVGSARGIDGRQRYQDPEDVVLNPLTSWGPTTDGRIKPDLVAVNRDDQLNSLKSPSGATDQAYSANFTGTSASAPLVTGALGLLVGYHHQLQGAGADSLFSSTYKALAIHAALEAGKYTGPDYQAGWGLFNAFGAAQVMRIDHLAGTRRHVIEDPLVNGGTQTYTLQSTGDAPLRVTLAWIDPYVFPFALQNDLDVRLLAPDGTLHLPWTLNPADPEAPAVRSDNTHDNVEHILVEYPVAGTYQVQVSHKQTLVDDTGAPAPQWFSLVTSHWDLMNPCLNQWLLDHLDIADARTYEAQSHVQTGANVRLLAGADVDYSAGTAVTLTPGFSAEAGSRLQARIEGCVPPVPGVAAARQPKRPDAGQQHPAALAASRRKAALSLSLAQNFPNPFAGRTQIGFTLPRDMWVRINLYNLLGQQVRTLRNQRLPAGRHTVDWDGKNEAGHALPGGTYLYRLQVDDQVRTRRMVLLR